MQIQVGVNENLVISKVAINDKGSLVVTVKEANEVDPLAALNSSGSTQFKPAEREIPIYAISVLNYDKQPDTVTNILNKIAEVKDPLNHILQQYMPNSQIKWDVFKGTGIATKESMNELTNQDILDVIYKNITEQFIRMITPYVSDTGKKMRFLFIRSSKAKHYPAFRKRFLESYPFIEPMEIPASASKLRFSDFEKKSGLDSGAPVSGAQTVSQEEKREVNELFTAN